MQTTEAIPILILTAKNEEAAIVKGLECEADDYITKPFSPKVLIARVNAPLLQQAMVNLVSNAVKYSPPQSPVEIKVELMKSEVVIHVRDWGSGMEEKHLAQLFERFYRVDPARSRKLGGTGLGLAIVKHIAQAHEGRVIVESTIESGSTFSLHLPRH